MEIEDFIKWLQLITLLVVGVCGIVLVMLVGGLVKTDLFDQLKVIFKIIVWLEWEPA